MKDHDHFGLLFEGKVLQFYCFHVEVWIQQGLLIHPMNQTIEVAVAVEVYDLDILQKTLYYYLVEEVALSPSCSS